MIVGCYDLHLYCDGLGCHGDKAYRERAQVEITDEFGSACRRRARALGWKLAKSQHALCPSCVKRGATIDPNAF